MLKLYLRERTELGDRLRQKMLSKSLKGPSCRYCIASEVMHIDFYVSRLNLKMNQFVAVGSQCE